MPLAGGDLGVRVRAQRLGLVPDGVPPVSAAPEAEIRWLVMPRPISCSAAPTQTPHSVGPRARTAPATAPWSRRMAAARRARTRHPNLKQTPLCRPGSRTASLGYETSSHGPTDGLARTSPAGVGPSWLATKSHTAVQAAVRHRSGDISPKDFACAASFYKPALPARDLRPALRTAAKTAREHRHSHCPHCPPARADALKRRKSDEPQLVEPPGLARRREGNAGALRYCFG